MLKRREKSQVVLKEAIGLPQSFTNSHYNVSSIFLNNFHTLITLINNKMNLSVILSCLTCLEDNSGDC